MTRRSCSICALAAPWLASLAMAAVDLDAQRSAWRFKRSLTLAAEGETRPEFAAVVLEPELAAACQPELRDLRLVDGAGREVAYVVDRMAERESQRRWNGTLVDTRQEARSRSLWTVDFGAARRFDVVELTIPSQDFAKGLVVEASDDGAGWHTVREGTGVFDRTWGGRVHHTTIDLGVPVTARYLRVTTDDTRSRPVSVQGIAVSASRRILGVSWTREARIEPLSSDRPGFSRYRLEIAPALPIETIRIDAGDPAFSRQVLVHETRQFGGREQQALLGERTLYRLRLIDAALSGEALEMAVQRPQGGPLVVSVQDGDSPPLRGLRVSVSGTSARLLFPRPDGPVVLFYGNPRTRAPLYDLEALKARIGLDLSFAEATLGPETPNPRFVPEPPLPFVAQVGAGLDVRNWRSQRGLATASGEELYTVRLAATDLARLRPDLGDLRVADVQDRQVPFVLELAVAEERVPLHFERDTSPARREARGLSRYRLVVSPTPDGKPIALPLSRLELHFAETFYSRPCRLLAAEAPSGIHRQTERVLHSGLLARNADSPEPAVIGLDGARRAELRLEIDEGDNAPLTLSRVEAVVLVPRIAFKAAAGGYRLLLGNERAQSPSYDIAALRQEVLAYSAVPVEAAPLEVNPAFRRTPGDYFKSAPPTLVLWGILLAAVVALVLLTVRIVRQPPMQP